MIYFAQGVDGGPVKIGTAVDVDRRLAQLEAHYGQPLALLATMPGGRDEERAIHERFFEIRLGRTEQFKPTFELMTFIGRPLLVGANPDAVEAMDSQLKPMVVQIRGSEEWKAWAEMIAEKEGDSVTKLFDHALRKFAKDAGYPDPPRR